MKQNYIIDRIKARAGSIPIVSTKLTSSDRWGAVKVRMRIKRMKYSVEPGLYGVGNPTKGSPVFVSANYKLSFDTLRKELHGLSGWILVLDTKGINVWCAAGKGTFGTEELVSRIKKIDLKKIINHRRLILPQLGAVGVAAHKVRRLSGFSVIYGPVRASDIKAFLEAGMKASPEMRLVNFTLYDRFKLIPVELVIRFKQLILCSILFFLLSGLNKNGYSTEMALNKGTRASLNLLFAYLAGTFIGPLLLPFLPGRSFYIKGFFLGIVLFVCAFLLKITGGNTLEILSWMLLIPAIASYLVLNFTGISTYTSLSGVKKEMRIALPLQISSAAAGICLWITNLFIR
jgi:acetyl-CoA decarbonylase/synthase complex subunit gamma